MPEEIFRIDDDDRLEPMTEKRFELEDKLQELVAKYPKLLSGEQMDPENPRRWILIGREQGIADIIGAGDRWSLDHLFIDQDAIPTLVEAKRSDNSEIRRSIVGQMMDYAAHATQTWSVSDIREAFEERCKIDELDPTQELAALIQPEDSELDVGKFWEDVETNLRAANLRLLFLADSIPSELARVVEFLNEQMPRTEVLAVEIKQFAGQTGRILAPRVIGRTASAPRRTSKRQRNKTLDELLNQMPNESVRKAARRLTDITKEKGGIVYSGSTAFSIRYTCPTYKYPISLAWVYPLPDSSGWMGTKNFTFGMGTYHDYELNDRPPAGIIEILELWTNQFKGDSFAAEYSAKGLDGWTISHEDAATNIDLLASRLEKVLDDLGELG